MDKEKTTINEDEVGKLSFIGDKMTIVGTDGEAKYELAADNTITDLRGHCRCKVKGEQPVCLICGLPLT